VIWFLHPDQRNQSNAVTGERKDQFREAVAVGKGCDTKVILRVAQPCAERKPSLEVARFFVVAHVVEGDCYLLA